MASEGGPSSDGLGGVAVGPGEKPLGKMAHLSFERTLTFHPEKTSREVFQQRKKHAESR